MTPQKYPLDPLPSDEYPPDFLDREESPEAAEPAEAEERPGCGWSLLLGLMGMAALLVFGLWAAREINKRNVAQPLTANYNMLPATAPIPASPEQELKIYFIAGGQFLAQQSRRSRDINDDAARIHQIARELANPPGSGLMETPLLGGAPRGLYLLRGIVYIDLNREFLQAPNQSPAMERLAIYSIVNSFMLNLPSLKGVPIMIDGQVVR
ncbi:GerMN domain-containing protein, partial [bacterium]|nr:GerMN domain-containing protein [bacterium]